MTAVIDNSSTDSRVTRMTDFVRDAGWDPGALALLAADASSRRYMRLQGGESAALLMDAPPAAEAPACPPEADETRRRALGYNAMARIAGPHLEAFTSLATYLREAGVRTPRVFAEDAKVGLAVIEDFGDALLARKIEAGTDEASLYARALAALRPLQKLDLVPQRILEWDLMTYDDLAYEAEAMLLPEWYADYRGITLPAGAAEEYAEILRELFPKLSPAKTITLRDYHAENILVPDDGPLAAIDFQDALIGQAAYDVVSLLEDARRDVDLGLVEELLAEERRHMPDANEFDRDYAILAAQRNAKILGIFARLVRRDGKQKYHDLLPRVEGHFRRDLDRPEVASLRAWCESYMPTLVSDYEGADD